MADRRMFSKQVIDSDAFLDLPATSQNLYFHLAMRADDDGFIDNPKKIQRITSTSDDDMKLLIAKGFLIGFDSGIIVIRHWRVHNYIQKDRKKSTVYNGEYSLLQIDSNMVYSLKTSDEQRVCSLYTNCIQPSKELYTQDRLIRDNYSQLEIEEVEEEEGRCNAFGVRDGDRPDYNSIEVYASSNLQCLSPGNMETLISYRDNFSDEMIRYAIDEATANGKPSFAYVRKILECWMQKGIKTLGDAKAAKAAKDKDRQSCASYYNASAHGYQERYNSDAELNACFVDLDSDDPMNGG